MNKSVSKWVGRWFLCIAMVISAAYVVAQDKVFAVVDDANFKSGEVVLDDQLFKLALDVKIVDETGKKTTIYALKQGTPIYFLAEGWQVHSVQLLPKGTPRPVVDDDE